MKVLLYQRTLTERDNFSMLLGKAARRGEEFFLGEACHRKKCSKSECLGKVLAGWDILREIRLERLGRPDARHVCTTSVKIAMISVSIHGISVLETEQKLSSSSSKGNMAAARGKS